MVPEETWKYLEMLLKSGYFWKCYAFYIQIQKKSHKVIQVKQYKWVKFVNTFAVVANAWSVLWVIIGCLVNEDEAVFILLVGIVAMLSLFTGIQIWYIRSMENISRIWRQFIDFNSYLSKRKM